MSTDPPSSPHDESAPTVSLHPERLATPPSDAPTIPPDFIPGFHIESCLGEGGMGVVYRAHQLRPSRTVALKIIRLSAVTPTSLRRFERETEILARLQHPCIAAIYEAGTAATPHGIQPYFAMELVEGQPLIKYATAHDLSLKDRLKLLAEIADAVHYAHQKGIIHRDLKPANILITPPANPGDSPHPKILDFGLAVANDSDIQLTTMHTEVGAILGTLSYMAPEQASGDPDQIDTRTDVYALGVIAYELLTGQLPYNLNNRAVFAAIRIIQTEEPSKLSSLNRTLRGDVDVIVSKAMEKEKVRRYQSANDMASDIRRHLNDQPITARRPSTFYQLRKFAKRNKILVAASLLIFLSLIAGIIATASQAHIAECNAADAQAALVQVQQERTIAETTARKLRDEKAFMDQTRYQFAIRSASDALELKDYSRTGELLEQGRPEHTGNVDFRRFEWFYLQKLLGERTNPSPDSVSKITQPPISSEEERENPIDAAFTKDGKPITAYTRFDPTAHLLHIHIADLATGQDISLITTSTGTKTRNTCVGPFFSPDGSKLAFLAQQGPLLIYSAPTGTSELSVGQFDFNARSEILFAAFSTDNSRVVTLEQKSDVESHIVSYLVSVWDLRANKKLSAWSLSQDAVPHIAFSPDGSRVAAITASYPGVWNIWDAQTGKLLAQNADSSRSDIENLCFSPDGKKIATIGSMVRTWDAATGAPLLQIEAPVGSRPPSTICFSADGTRLVAIYNLVDAGVFSVWDAAKGLPLLHLEQPLYNTIRHFTASPDNNGFLLVQYMGEFDKQFIHLWDASHYQDTDLDVTDPNSIAIPQLQFVRTEATIAEARWDPNGMLIIEFEGAQNSHINATLAREQIPDPGSPLISSPTATLVGAKVRVAGSLGYTDEGPRIALDHYDDLTILTPPPTSTTRPAATSPAEIKNITPEDTLLWSKLVGTPVHITGTITAAEWLYGDTLLLARFQYADDNAPKLLIYQKNRKPFDDAFTGDLASNLPNQKIEATGILHLHNGRPQIELTSPTQLKIVPPDP